MTTAPLECRKCHSATGPDWPVDGECPGWICPVCYSQSQYVDDFGMSPDQFHAVLDKLWAALGVSGVQELDVFTLSADQIKALKAEVQRLREAGDKAREWLEDIVPAVGGSWLKEYYTEGYGPEIREVIAQLTAALRVP